MTPRDSRAWPDAGSHRRATLVVLVLLPVIIASWHLVGTLPRKGGDALEMAIVAVFAMLFVWISLGFWTAILGFFILLRGSDRFDISLERRQAPRPLDSSARTAIIIPVYNEDAQRVFGGLKATYRSLERAGALEAFDFYVLSDSNDPDRWVDEEVCWARLCRELDAFGRIFYRHRRINLKRKTGNVADFCRRWGANYRYMVVFDADSIMSGPALARAIGVMEQHPDVGILQTVPMPVNGESLLARIQQFASRVYGPVFSAGLNFWQLGDGHYWGHNCVIRVAPFMRHCAMPRLSGRPPLGGEILSHDFVEAALIRRAGWKVWLGYALDQGSYEETPPTLLDELKRDQRWCQGNLQHARVLGMRGLNGCQRFLFVNGIMAYGAAPLWFLLFVLGAAEVIVERLRVPVYFVTPFSLFPDWPVSRPEWAIALLISTLGTLFLPKLLAVLLVFLRGQTGRFGGGFNLLVSVALEFIVSMLLAPIRMLFHSRFVMQTLLGRTIHWGPQRRGSHDTSWGEAARMQGGWTILGIAWGIAAYQLNTPYFLWLTPVFAGLILSIPLTVMLSRTSIGRAARHRGLFLIGEELYPPRELHTLRSALKRTRSDGFMGAIVDPYVNALHLTLLKRTRSKAKPGSEVIRTKLLEEGVEALSRLEKLQILKDANAVSDLHMSLWSGASKASPQPA